MNTDTTASSNGEIPEVFLEGLALDVSILDALLERHRCSHGRTIYFRRMSMTLNRLIRRERGNDGSLRKMMVVADAVYRLYDLQKNIIAYQQEQNPKSTNSRKRRHNEGEEQWDLQSLHTKAKNLSSQPGLIEQEFQELVHIWRGTIPEILSRIQHASKSLFVEVSRGFFLPFCTVALGALARIRALLMEIGIRGLTKIRDLSEEVLQIVLPKNNKNPALSILTDADYEHCINLFLENDDETDRKRNNFVLHNSNATHQNVKFDQSAILRSLGLTESTTTNPKPAETPKCDNSEIEAEIPINGNEGNNQEQVEPSTDDYYTLASSAPLEQHEMDDGTNMDDNKKMPPKSLDSLDGNMALVDRFQKRKRDEKHFTKKEKKPKKMEDDSKPKALPEEPERQKRKSSKTKDSTKKKRKRKAKKGKGDFFDQIFD